MARLTALPDAARHHLRGHVSESASSDEQDDTLLGSQFGTHDAGVTPPPRARASLCDDGNKRKSG